MNNKTTVQNMGNYTEKKLDVLKNRHNWNLKVKTKQNIYSISVSSGIFLSKYM